jgi:hypothetical protein
MTTMGANRLYTYTKLMPYKMGENIFTRQVGTVDNEGYCTGQGMVYHCLQYARERATVTIRIKLSQRKFALDKHRDTGFKCNLLKHQSTHPGGVMYWEAKACPAAAIYRGTMISNESVFRTPTKREVNEAACLYPQVEQKGCNALDDVFSGTDLPRKCRNLCKDEPQASKMEAFCKEVSTALLKGII